MMSFFSRMTDWLDHRTGYRRQLHEALYENVPGGARWRYVTGSMLVFAFVTQVITGIFLWMCYSPSSQTAWESVYFIQNEMQGGWLLRGVHHFMAQAMVVLLPIHMLQVIIDKAYKAPREINFWLGMILALLVLGLGLTGYLLPWDQKGYWATKVATNLMSLSPGGPYLQKLVVGGSDYGHHTLTRFFALHAGVLPALLVVVLGLHVALFRRHGLTEAGPKKNVRLAVLLTVLFGPLGVFYSSFAGGMAMTVLGIVDWILIAYTQTLRGSASYWVLFVVCTLLTVAVYAGSIIWAIRGVKSFRLPGDQTFWPHQVFKDGFACMLLLAVVLVAIIGPSNVPKLFVGGLPPMGQLGAELTAPADPSEEYSAARPEWYFLFLFQLLKKFKSEFIGAIVVPGVVTAFLFALPLISKVKFGHVINVVSFFVLIIVAGYLTAEAWYQDNYSALVAEDPGHSSNPDGEHESIDDAAAERYKASKNYLEAVEQAHNEYDRIKQLIEYYGIPQRGAIELVRNDPEIMGPRLFRRHCASCHSYLDENGEGIEGPKPSSDDTPNGAPNLYGFARESWFRGLLSTDPETGFNSPHYFGQTSHKNGEMYTDGVEPLADLDEAGKKELDQLIEALVFEAELVDHRESDAKLLDAGSIESGRDALISTFSCTDCHKFHDEGDIVDDGYPDLTGYGSHQWLRDFIRDPAHERFYGGGNDRMPAFAEHPDDPKKNILTDHEIDMLVRWIRRDDQDLSLKIAALKDQATRKKPEEAAENGDAAPETSPKPEDTEPLGAKLFRQRCARCHPFTDAQGQGIAGPTPRGDGTPNGAPNLHGFASRDWLRGFLDPEQIITDRYFGNTAHKDGQMVVDYVNEMLDELSDSEKAELETVIAALSAEAALPAQAEAEAKAEEEGVMEQGRDALVNTFLCTDCHKFRDEGALGDAPDLTGYGSREWLIGMISDPTAERFYRDTNDRMPSFGAHLEGGGANKLSDEEIESLVDWIRGEAAPAASEE